LAIGNERIYNSSCSFDFILSCVLIFFHPQNRLSGVQSSGTIEHFLKGRSVDGFSSLALLAKASILLERAAAANATISTTPNFREFNMLDSLIDRFQRGLPLKDQIDVGPSAKRMLLVTATIVHAATILLHAPFTKDFETSREKSFAAVRSVAQSLSCTNLYVFQHIDPIMAILWLRAAEAIVTEILGLHGTLSTSGTVDRRQQLVSDLNTIVDTMTAFASTSPLLDKSASRVREVLLAIET